MRTIAYCLAPTAESYALVCTRRTMTTRQCAHKARTPQLFRSQSCTSGKIFQDGLAASDGKKSEMADSRCCSLRDRKGKEFPLSRRGITSSLDWSALGHYARGVSASLSSSSTTINDINSKTRWHRIMMSRQARRLTSARLCLHLSEVMGTRLCHRRMMMRHRNRSQRHRRGGSMAGEVSGSSLFYWSSLYL